MNQLHLFFNQLLVSSSCLNEEHDESKVLLNRDEVESIYSNATK